MTISNCIHSFLPFLRLTSILWGFLGGSDSEESAGGGQEEKGVAEDEMVGWHQRLNGPEFGQTPGDGEGQGSLACCRPWG